MAGSGVPKRHEDELDRLYGVPLGEFVRERDALARRLRKEGRRDEAEAVKSLPKPSLPAWVVNQLARRREAEVRALVSAAERLRDVQATGRGDFAAAAAAEREAVAKLVSEARDLVREAGGSANEATLSRVGRTLHAAAAADEARAELERGRLTRELEPAGFGSLLGAVAEAPLRPARIRNERARRPAAEKAKPAARPASAAAKELARRAVVAARERARDRRREAIAAERAVAEARRALERAEREAESARAQAAAAAAEAARAERRLREL